MKFWFYKSTKEKGFVEFMVPVLAALGFAASVVLLSLNSARAKSRDAKRVADIRQLSSAIELYKNDKAAVPNKLSDLTPVYIGMVPTAPFPADGNCTLEENTYTYTKSSSINYEITFCLGGVTGGYSPGKHILSRHGIK
jgi:type II secretory pathway pseudopilin PulG